VHGTSDNINCSMNNNQHDALFISVYQVITHLNISGVSTAGQSGGTMYVYTVGP
jgi:hypothetical protein